MNVSFVVTLALIVILSVGGIYAGRRGLIESKGLLLAIALLVLLLVGYLMIGGSAPP